MRTRRLHRLDEMLAIEEVFEICGIAVQLKEIGFTPPREMRQEHRGAGFHREARAVQNVAADVSDAAGARVARDDYIVSRGAVLAEVREGWEVEGVGDLVGEKVGDEVAAAAAAMLSEIWDETGRLGGANVERDVVDGDEGEEGGEDAGFERNAADDGFGDGHFAFPSVCAMGKGLLRRWTTGGFGRVRSRVVPYLAPALERDPHS